MTFEELVRLELYVGAVLFGAVVGSFLNVCIWRIPRRESIVTPRSRCPACGAAIPWYLNIPVVSWFVLRGRCAECAAAISWRYPFVEALNAALWLLVAWRFGLSVQTFLLLPFVSAMIVLFFTDWDHQILPDRVTWPLGALGLLVAPWNPALDLAPGWFGGGTPLTRIGSAIAGAGLGYGIFFFLALAWRVLFDRDALGGGDLKMMVGVGAFTGVPGVVVTIMTASVVGSLGAAPFLLTGRWDMTRELPFGCFLAPAAVLAALWGDAFVRWYLGLLWM